MRDFKSESRLKKKITVFSAETKDLVEYFRFLTETILMRSIVVFASWNKCSESLRRVLDKCDLSGLFLKENDEPPV